MFLKKYLRLCVCVCVCLSGCLSSCFCDHHVLSPAAVSYTFEQMYYVFDLITLFVCLCVCLSVCHHVCGEMAALSNKVSSMVKTI